jgi:hypothetical protein
MDELFSLLMRLIPVALLAGYWILRIRRMVANRRQRQQDDASPPSQDAPDRALSLASGDEEEPHFSAWDLPVTEPEVPAPPVPEKPVQDLSAGMLASMLREDEDAAEAPNPEPPGNSADKPEETRWAHIPGAGQQRKAREASRRINKPPLKKAVIWAEILGPPKGL